jgi:acetyl esterase/lipase
MKFSAVWILIPVTLVALGRDTSAEETTRDLQTPYTAVEDVVYGNKLGMGLTLDVIQPQQGAKHIGVLLISSGGWKSEKSNVPDDVKKFRRVHWLMGLLNSGYTVFVTRHGSTPRFQVPEMIEDVRRAVRFVRLHAKEYGIDPDHIGITSGSSGGHLALMVATTGDDGNPESPDPVERVSSRVQAVVSWFPPTDLVNWGRENGYQLINTIQPKLFKDVFGEITDLPAQLKSISPYYFVTEDDPPLLLIHGTADLTVPLQQSEVMKAKYEEVGLDVQLNVIPKAGHTMWPGIEKQYTDVAAWFDRYLIPKSDEE